MTAPIPPTAGAMAGTPAEKLAGAPTGTPMDIRAPYDDSIPGEMAAAVEAGKAWNAAAGELWHSEAGFGSGGFTIAQEDPDGDAEWPTDVSFPHAGP